MVALPIIAVVDDDPGVRGSIDSLLRSAGLGCLTFDSGEHFMTSGLVTTASCVVTDLHLPGMSGLELQSQLVMRGFHRPLVLMTAYPTETIRHAAVAGGAVAFLTKPIDPEALLGLLLMHSR